MSESHETETLPPKRLTKMRIAGALLTLFGIGLFALLIYSVGFNEIVEGIGRFGFAGFAVILSIYFVRITARSLAWKLSVYSPYHLNLRDTVPAVIIGEAMSSTIPLGILISGTSKAVAVRKKIPLVAALSSVATENLFYSLVTGIYLILGAILMLRVSVVDEAVMITLNGLIVLLVVLLLLGITMVVRQWHIASELCEKIYKKGYLKKFLENGRLHVRLFENLIYDFYRRHPGRFLPICLLEASYHVLGVLEVFYILTRIVETNSNLRTAFLLESVSRLVTIVFKLVPFNIGVDEAGAQFVGDAIALAAGIGVTLAIIRKGRILFWTAIGWILIIRRGLSFSDIADARNAQANS